MADGDVTRSLGIANPLSITLASLASSASRTAGRSSAVIQPTAPVMDEIVEGFITTGISPTAGKQIDVWVYASFASGSIAIDTIDGTDADQTLTSENVRNGALALAASIVVDSTSGRTYPVAPFSIAALFGGQMPKAWGLFVTHDTDTALNGTGGNHEMLSTQVHVHVEP